MNMFKHLDAHFPTVDSGNRIFGEVVSIELSVSDDIEGVSLLIAEKRKAVYVNASVNAFHMHRSLVGQLKRSSLFMTSEGVRAASRRIAYLVNLCYTREARNNNSVQYYSFSLRVTNNGFETIVSHTERSTGVPTKEQDSCTWNFHPYKWYDLSAWSDELSAEAAALLEPLRK
jgi:hypothetical protein